MPGSTTDPDLDKLITTAAAQYNLNPDLFRRQLVAESNLRPDATNPTSGAQGIAQFMPGTAASLGVDAYDPKQAIPAAANYMRANLNQFGGDYGKALTAYIWGPGNVAKYGADAAPPAAKAYVAAIQSVKPSGQGPMQSAPAAPTPAPAPIPDPQTELAQVTPPTDLPAPQPPAMPPGVLPNPLGGPTSLADAFVRASRAMRPTPIASA